MNELDRELKAVIVLFVVKLDAFCSISSSFEVSKVIAISFAPTVTKALIIFIPVELVMTILLLFLS